MRRQNRAFFINRLWLLENNFDFISETKIRFKIDVFFENEEVTSEIIEDDEQRSFNFDTNSGRHFVQEILYEKPGHSSTLITRHISQRHKLPVEYINLLIIQETYQKKNFFWTCIMMILVPSGMYTISLVVFTSNSEICRFLFVNN